MFDLENFGGGSINNIPVFEMIILSLKVPECKPVLYHELLIVLLTGIKHRDMSTFSLTTCISLIPEIQLSCVL